MTSDACPRPAGRSTLSRRGRPRILRHRLRVAVAGPSTGSGHAQDGGAREGPEPRGLKCRRQAESFQNTRIARGPVIGGQAMSIGPRAKLYTRYPLSSILIYNGSTILLFLWNRTSTDCGERVAQTPLACRPSPLDLCRLSKCLDDTRASLCRRTNVPGGGQPGPAPPAVPVRREVRIGTGFADPSLAPSSD